MLERVLGEGWWTWRERRDHGERPFPASMAWLLDNPVAQLQARWEVPRLGLRASMRVLDAGCGPGRFTIPIAERVGPSGEVIALDLQDDMLRIVERRAAGRGLANVRTRRAGLGEGKLAEVDALDLAVMISVLGEVPRELRGACVREITGALKPGGRFVVVEHFGDPDYLSPDTVKGLGEAAGLRVGAERRRLLGHSVTFEKPVRAA